jgi:hypothetical protein
MKRRQLLGWINEVLSENGLELMDEKELDERCRQLSMYFPDQPTGFKINGEVLKFPEIRVDWDDFDQEAVKDKVKTRMPFDPLLLRKKIHSVSKDLEERLLRKTDFLMTNSLSMEKSIQERFRVVLREVSEYLYICVAFGEDDIPFFWDFLSDVVKRGNIEFKMLYRARNKKNREIVASLAEQLEGLGNFREYSRERLRSTYEVPYIGNLHSKMIVTEKYLLVGSANVTKQSLEYNLETAIGTNDPDLIHVAKSAFEEVYDAFSRS